MTDPTIPDPYLETLRLLHLTATPRSVPAARRSRRRALDHRLLHVLRVLGLAR